MAYAKKQFGFTLLELMVAVVVLLAVMLAVGRIFSTTSDVSASGKAIAETLQQAVAIEQQLREDISKVSKEGFFAIRCASVANNIRGNYFLIDESLPPEAIIRCDQLIFFADGIATPMLNATSTDFAGQGLATMLYYGHGVKFPQIDGQSNGISPGDIGLDDPKFFNTSIQEVVTPWYEGLVEIETRNYSDGGDDRFDILVPNAGPANGTQQEPSDWILCRQAVILGDDDQEAADHYRKKTYMGRGISSNTIFPWDPRIESVSNSTEVYPHVMQGRVDIAATQLDDIRQSVLEKVEDGSLLPRYWRVFDDIEVDQQELIASLFRWIRVEPYPPSTLRWDQALAMASIAEGCVSFQIEWTYDEGTGFAEDANGNTFTGYGYDQTQSHPWWGGSYRVNPDDPSNLAIYYDTLSGWTSDAYNGTIYGVPAWSVDPSLIETTFVIDEGPLVAPVPTIQDVNNGVSEYWAIFGYNSSNPFYENSLDFLNDLIPDNGSLSSGGMDDGSKPGDATWRYTPWPSSLRVTVRLLDRDNRLGAGWTHQFVVELPERNK